MDCGLNARRHTELFVLHITIMHSSLSAFLQAAKILADHRSYVSLSKQDSETLQPIGWFCAAFDSMRVSFQSCEAALWPNKMLLYAQEVPFACLPIARRKR